MLDDNPRKGSDVLIAALSRLANTEQCLLLLVGQGGESWAGQVPMPVHCLGFLDEVDKIAQAYAAADLVVIPSVLENLPNTLIESLACGRAVVASDCGGMRDGVDHGKTGFLVPVGDADALAARLDEVLANDSLREQFEQQARALFEREFSIEQEASRFEALYAGILSSDKTKSS